jgi:hypothetical protein
LNIGVLAVVILASQISQAINLNALQPEFKPRFFAVWVFYLILLLSITNGRILD